MAALAAAFIASRLLCFTLVAPNWTDLPIYERYANNILSGQIPYIDFNIEYPPLALIFFILPAFAAKIVGRYDVSYRMLMFLFDLGIIYLMWAMAKYVFGDNRLKVFRALFFYIILTGISFQLLYDRLDLAVAFLILLSMYFALVLTRWRISYVLLWAVVLVKVFPAILFPVLIISQIKMTKKSRQAFADFGLASAVFAFFMIALIIGFGRWWDQVISYHGHRGIQIESLYASIVMLSGFLGIPSTINHDFGSFNIVNSFTPLLAGIAPFLTAISILVVYFLFRRNIHFRKEAKRPASSMLVASLAALFCFVILNKVLSPQYLLWLFPLAALTCNDSRHSTLIVGLWLLTATTTAVLFPYSYPSLVMQKSTAVILQIVRNLSLLGLAILAFIDLINPIASNHILGARGRLKPRARSAK